MESAFLNWNWVLARSSLSQCYDFHTSYQEKPICYLRMVLFKYGTLVGNGYATNDMFKLSIIYQYVLVVLILFVPCYIEIFKFQILEIYVKTWYNLYKHDDLNWMVY